MQPEQYVDPNISRTVVVLGETLIASCRMLNVVYCPHMEQLLKCAQLGLCCPAAINPIMFVGFAKRTSELLVSRPDHVFQPVTSVRPFYHSEVVNSNFFDDAVVLSCLYIRFACQVQMLVNCLATTCERAELLCAATSCRGILTSCIT